MTLWCGNNLIWQQYFHHISKGYTTTARCLALQPVVRVIALWRHQIGIFQMFFLKTIPFSQIKFSIQFKYFKPSELQDEIQRLISCNTNKIKSINLIHCNIKNDFLQKQLLTIQQYRSTNKQYKYALNQVNLSRNTIEDKGAIILSNIFKEFTTTGYDVKFNSLALSRCLINSKGMNSISSVLKENFACTLTHLDLSFNSLKDDPTVRLEQLWLLSVKTWKPKKNYIFRNYSSSFQNAIQ